MDPLQTQLKSLNIGLPTIMRLSHIFMRHRVQTEADFLAAIPLFSEEEMKAVGAVAKDLLEALEAEEDKIDEAARHPLVANLLSRLVERSGFPYETALFRLKTGLPVAHFILPSSFRRFIEGEIALEKGILTLDGIPVDLSSFTGEEKIALASLLKRLKKKHEPS